MSCSLSVACYGLHRQSTTVKAVRLNTRCSHVEYHKARSRARAHDERDGRARNLSQSGRPRSTAGNKKVITVCCEAHQGSTGVRASKARLYKVKIFAGRVHEHGRRRAIFIVALQPELEQSTMTPDWSASCPPSLGAT